MAGYLTQQNGHFCPIPLSLLTINVLTSQQVHHGVEVHGEPVDKDGGREG